ncbi:ThuA domain-containing protein [Algibacter sp. L4_22]|uniref:ThuA domain-containing protein n=1 Tax=Algibacter sp. L4_22 TaxID=2942477 RepID=UPI00201B5CD4|nr:ThuA domain-containing protein [Algibacter sp. L4_22]MCL5126798.1 ThuA domain-containing protein [Algibacter sp. L4_22]
MKAILIVVLVFFTLACNATDHVLVFSKTEGFRHKSIETGVKAIETLGADNNFKVTHSEDSKVFLSKKLKKYDLIIFLSTTGDILNSEEEAAFKKYINNGGSFLGIHAATDTEFEWEWYGKLVGAYFVSHPKQAQASIEVKDKNHEATKHLPSPWSHYDEWYNFKSISSDIHVLLTLDESSYTGGENGEFHPIAWCQEFDGGRMFYTGLGHTVESYSNPEFRAHLLGGILYCLDK